MKKIAVLKLVSEIESNQMSSYGYIKKIFPEFDWNNSDHEDMYDLEEDLPRRTWYQGDPMPIQELEDIVKELKERGSEYVNIVHHEDHNNHVFIGLILKLKDPEQILKDKQYEIDKLKKEINRYNGILINLNTKIKELEKE